MARTQNMDYPYLQAWGEFMGSYQSYIDGEVQKARKMGAPRTAIFERDGRWHTYDEISSLSTKIGIWGRIKEFGIDPGPEPDHTNTFAPLTFPIGGFGDHVVLSQVNANDPEACKKIADEIQDTFGVKYA